MTIASMPMYDMPEVRPALDAWWRGIARHLKAEGIADVPETLERDQALDAQWTDPALFFSQCCGFDLAIRHPGVLTPIATPHFDAPECHGHDYRSVIAVRDDCAAGDIGGMRGTVAAINDRESHSGMNALRALVAPLSHGEPFFARVMVTGSHANSVAAVREGDADIAAVDCVSFAMIARHRPHALDGIRALGTTDPAPAIPYVTRSTMPAETVARMQSALFRAFDDPSLDEPRKALLLRGVDAVPLGAYQRIGEFRDIAVKHGYPTLI